MRLPLTAVCLAVLFIATAAFDISKTRDPLELEAQMAMGYGSEEPISLEQSVKTSQLPSRDGRAHRMAMLLAR